jgi:two-component system OmpR family response regulator
MRARGVFSALTVAGADMGLIPIHASRAGIMGRHMRVRRKDPRRAIFGRGVAGAAGGRAAISVWMECVAAVADREAGKRMRVLLVEDDNDLQRLLKTALSDAGYVVDTAADGEEGHFLGDTEPYDVVILDLGLPKMDGVRVLEQWRKAGRKMPVLILTARDRWSDKVAGFDAGADDYLAKPFYTEELLARVRALLRRAAGLATSEIEVGPLRIDTRSSRVTYDGNPVKLTSLEYRLLAYLAHHRGRVVSRTELVEHLYDQDFDRDSNTIEVFVGRLRKKLEPNLIQTVRGLGYCLEVPDTAPYQAAAKA